MKQIKKIFGTLHDVCFVVQVMLLAYEPIATLVVDWGVLNGALMA